ncbi:hypothetical protein PR048_004120 [Dryococelus australis]|uniref:Uncharacterized protein n=1 Tax=Dryococelus australis TaxID=614101 RepID=A0ABQ9I515_9NEOP|nr:hypothetical protein PR048_004120 [Dryococelus australis]
MEESNIQKSLLNANEVRREDAIYHLSHQMKNCDDARICPPYIPQQTEIISGRNCRAPSGTFEKPESTVSEYPLSRVEDCQARPNRAEYRKPLSRTAHIKNTLPRRTPRLIDLLDNDQQRRQDSARVDYVNADAMNIVRERSQNRRDARAFQDCLSWLSDSSGEGRQTETAKRYRRRNTKLSLHANDALISFPIPTLKSIFSPEGLSKTCGLNFAVEKRFGSRNFLQPCLDPSTPMRGCRGSRERQEASWRREMPTCDVSPDLRGRRYKRAGGMARSGSEWCGVDMRIAGCILLLAAAGSLARPSTLTVSLVREIDRSGLQCCTVLMRPVTAGRPYTRPVGVISWTRLIFVRAKRMNSLQVGFQQGFRRDGSKDERAGLQRVLSGRRRAVTVALRRARRSLRRDVQGVLTSGLCVLCGLVRETSSARREIQLLQPNGWYKGPHKCPSTPPALSFRNDEREGTSQNTLVSIRYGGTCLPTNVAQLRTRGRREERCVTLSTLTKDHAPSDCECQANSDTHSQLCVSWSELLLPLDHKGVQYSAETSELVFLADVHLVYAAAQWDSRAAAHMHRERYRNRRVPIIHCSQPLIGGFANRGHLRRKAGHPRAITTPHFEEEMPSTSTRQVAHAVRAGHMDVWRVVHEQLQHPYRRMKVEDYPQRSQFARHVWEENTRAPFIWNYQELFGDNVWCVTAGDSLIWPYMFLACLNGDRYVVFMEQVLPELLEDVPLGILQEMWLQHDSAPPHFSAHVLGLWPERSPDLTPLDFYLWDAVKCSVYETSIASLEDLVARMHAAAEDTIITPGVFDRVRQS